MANEKTPEDYSHKKAEGLVNENISEAEETAEEVEADKAGIKEVADREKVQPAEDIEHGWKKGEKDEEGGIAETGS